MCRSGREHTQLHTHRFNGYFPVKPKLGLAACPIDNLTRVLVLSFTGRIPSVIPSGRSTASLIRRIHTDLGVGHFCVGSPTPVPRSLDVNCEDLNVFCRSFYALT